MIKWQIVFSKTGEKELNKLDHQSAYVIIHYLYTRILQLNHPKESGKALTRNKKGLWRYRVDKFRIICKLEEGKLVVLVVKRAQRDVVHED